MIPMNKFSMEKWKLSALKDNSAQPEGRTKNLKRLLEDIEANGLLSPLAINPHGVIIDGHRRKAALELLGVSEVHCVVVRTEKALTQADEFSGLNLRDEINTIQIFHTWAQDRYPLKNIKPATRRNILTWIKFLGNEKAAKRLGLSKTMSPSAINHARRAYAALQSATSKKAIEITPQQITDWLSKHGLTNDSLTLIRYAVRSEKSFLKGRLADRINKDEPASEQDIYLR